MVGQAWPIVGGKERGWWGISPPLCLFKNALLFTLLLSRLNTEFDQKVICSSVDVALHSYAALDDTFQLELTYRYGFDAEYKRHYLHHDNTNETYWLNSQ